MCDTCLNSRTNTVEVGGADHKVKLGDLFDVQGVVYADDTGAHWLTTDENKCVRLSDGYQQDVDQVDEDMVTVLQPGQKITITVG